MRIALGIALLVLWFLLPLGTKAQQMHLSWMKSAGGIDWDMVTGMTVANNNIYVTGGYYGYIRFEADSFASAGNRDVFVAAYQPDGSFKNAFCMGSQGFDFSYKILCDIDGNLIVPCKTHHDLKVGNAKVDSIGKINLMLLWLSPEGELLNHFAFAASEQASFTDLCLDPEGDLYFTGNFAGGLTIEGKSYLTERKSLKVSDDSDIFAGKINKQGKLMWFNQWGDKGEDLAFNLQSDGKGVLIMTGSTVLGCFGDKLSKPEPVKKEKHLFVAQLNPSGKVSEVHYPFHGFDFSTKGIAFQGNEVWISARFRYRVASGSKILESNGNNDILLMNSKLDKIDFQYQQLGGTGNEIPVQITPSGGYLVLAGTYTEPLAINKTTLLSENQEKEIFLLTIDKEKKYDKVFTLKGNRSKFANTLYTASSGVYLAGDFTQNINSGEVKLETRGKEDVYLARFENCDAKNPLKITIDTLSQGGKNPVYELSVGEGFLSYLWNDSPGKSLFKTNKPGMYYVEVNDNFGCYYIDSVSISQSKSLLLSDPFVQMGQIKVYPTLAHNWVNVITDQDIVCAGFSIGLTDMNGKQVLLDQYEGNMQHNRIYRLDVSGLAPGSYLIRLSSEQGVQSAKIVVKPKS